MSGETEVRGAISYALFFKENQAFDFPSYLRGFMLNLRFRALIYPGWKVILNTDTQTFEKYGEFFEKLPIEVQVNEPAPLTKAMLWRMKPIFDYTHPGWNYTHVLCRDVDSPLTYKERQAVEYWIRKDTAAHAITDSVSHDVPMMGGMIGFRPAYFADKMGCRTWDELMALGDILDYSTKGADQTFLTKYVYPKMATHGSDSIVQHYFQGMPNTFLPNFNTCNCSPLAPHVLRCPNDIEIDLPIEMKESQSCCGHIGASGWYETATNRFLRKYHDRFLHLAEAEEMYPDIFHWLKDGSI